MVSQLADSRKAAMLQATAYISFLLPIGTFVMDPALGVISFKRTVSYKVDALKEDIANMIGYEIFESLRLVELFVAPLLANKNEDIAWEEFVKASTSHM